jgi:HSP20 family molecular chaperone IbpA
MAKRSFFERLTGAVPADEELDEVPSAESARHLHVPSHGKKDKSNIGEANDSLYDETQEGELTVDVYQTTNDIVVKTMIAGVKPEDMDISITRDMVTIKGRRQESQDINGEDYFYRELYWGSFSRTIMLPQEIDVDSAEATERNGLLTLRLPKLDKNRQTKVKVKSS